MNKPAQIVTLAELRVLGDYDKHVQFGSSLNPYSTVGNREDWQRGFDNSPARSYEGDVAYGPAYQRGRAMARLLESKKEVSQ